MRDYGKVGPTFWTGDTGRRLRAAGRDAQLVALYLVTGPNANMIGLYHLPVPLIAHHTGLTTEGASEARRRASEAGFCRYDDAAEVVWVPEMAAYQLGEPLVESDKRVAGVVREWQAWRKSKFYAEFHRRYAASFHLPVPSPSEGPCKPLRSQEQEQEQEKEQEQERPAPQGGSGEPAKPASPPPADPAAGEVLRFPIVGNKHQAEWVLTHGTVAEHRELYPTVDVLAECRKALAWIKANPCRRKTAKGMPRFLVTWLNRATDRGGPPPAGRAGPDVPQLFASQVFDLLVAGGTPPPAAGPYAEWAGRLARVVGWSRPDAAARVAEWYAGFQARRVTAEELEAAAAELAARKEPLKYPGDVLPAVNASVARRRAEHRRAAESPRREEPPTEEQRAVIRRKVEEARARVGRFEAS